VHARSRVAHFCGSARTRAAPRARRRSSANRARAAAQVQSLRKYRRVFKLGDPQTFGSKEELLPAVVRHWQNQARPPRRAARLRALHVAGWQRASRRV
jgi:hypothetical protein